MPEFTCRNVNSAFRTVVSTLHRSGHLQTVMSKSRVGDVIQIARPVLITYLCPTERVLFNQARDANPFFHVMEALWMLVGRDDVAPMVYYASDYGNITSDDGETANGAYGRRWREGYVKCTSSMMGHCEENHADQLGLIIQHLKVKPESRRAVLSMWNIQDDLLNIGGFHAAKVGNDKWEVDPGVKDVCCNLSATFQLLEGKLDMTVFNRSNDLIWGSLGANVVHFSFLQEYVAAHLQVPMGVYNQISTNLHVYTARWKPDDYLADETPDYYIEGRAPTVDGPLKPFPFVADPATFDNESPEFFEYWVGRDLTDRLFNKVYQEPFLQHVALPMAKAFYWHKERNYEQCSIELSRIKADDWRLACCNWILKRRLAWEKKNELATNSDSPKE